MLATGHKVLSSAFLSNRLWKYGGVTSHCCQHPWRKQLRGNRYFLQWVHSLKYFLILQRLGYKGPFSHYWLWDGQGSHHVGLSFLYKMIRLGDLEGSFQLEPSPVLFFCASHTWAAFPMVVAIDSQGPSGDVFVPSLSSGREQCVRVNVREPDINWPAVSFSGFSGVRVIGRLRLCCRWTWP